MNLFHLALDVLREAAASRYLLGIAVLLLAGMALLAGALDLEVVEGALAASRIFGRTVGDTISPVDVALRPFFQALVYAVYFGGLLFGVVSTAGIAPRLFAPGRVEMWLSLPVRRWELVVGTYLGVIALSWLVTLFAVTGIAGVLMWKGGFWTGAPWLGAGFAALAFLPVYGVMLLAALWIRSAPLSAGSGLLFTGVCLVTSDRASFLAWFRDGDARAVLDVLISPLPPLATLAQLGAEVAGGQKPSPSAVVLPTAIALCFTLGTIALSCFRVSGKDY